MENRRTRGWLVETSSFVMNALMRKLFLILILGIFFFTAGPSSVAKSDLIQAVVENAKEQTWITKSY